MHPEALDKKSKPLLHLLAGFKDFYLAGGTALAIQIGHRISVDFDLFSDKEIDSGLLVELKKIFSDREIIVSVNNPGELTVFIDGVKLTFLHYPFPVLSDFVEYEGLKLLSVKEIAVTKAYTIGRRGSYKDYADLYFVIAEGHSSLEEIIKLGEKKYGAEFNPRLFLEQLTYLDDVQDEGVLFLKKGVTREKIRKFFEEKIREIKL